MITSVLLIVIAYLCGSISAAILYAKIAGLPDPRKQGSGNPGATNILRLAGKKAAVIVAVGDVLKGVIPVILAKFFGLSLFWQSFVALAAFIGHLYPIYFGFKGGKGVATTIGVIIALSPPVGLAATITWLLVAVIFRYSSLASLVMAISLPAYAAMFKQTMLLPSLLIMAGLIVLRHRSNIRKLLLGQESKIGQKTNATGDKK